MSCYLCLLRCRLEIHRASAQSSISMRKNSFAIRVANSIALMCECSIEKKSTTSAGNWMTFNNEQTSRPTMRGLTDWLETLRNSALLYIHAWQAASMVPIEEGRGTRTIAPKSHIGKWRKTEYRADSAPSASMFSRELAGMLYAYMISRPDKIGGTS